MQLPDRTEILPVSESGQAHLTTHQNDRGGGLLEQKADIEGRMDVSNKER